MTIQTTVQADGLIKDLNVASEPVTEYPAQFPLNLR